MRPVLLFLFVAVVYGNDVTRDFFGDIFRMRDCHNGSRCDDGGKRPALEVPGRPCYCQCAPTHLAYREDKQQCVKDIRECYMSVFYRPFTVEAIPLVYLPTSGQLVHPDAHLSLAGRKNSDSGFPTCKAAVSQYLTRDGWRTLAQTDGGGPVFGLFADNNKTFLQFLGNSNDRRVLQQHLALIRLFCRIPEYSPFETCVAIRVGWVPGIDSVEESESKGGKANMMVVGLSLGVLGLVYVFAVLVYLKIRRQLLAKQKTKTDQEAKLQSHEAVSDKTSCLNRLETSSRLELYHANPLSRQKHGSLRRGHDPWNQMSPIVETYNRTWTDRMGQHGCEFRAQDFKLQPEFFEPEFMASPPQQVLEYLERLQNSVTFARHRLRTCYRYQPTLIDIPEDDYFYQELDNKNCPTQEKRTTPDGGSASSVETCAERADKQSESSDIPKVPPRKPKRKSRKITGAKSSEFKNSAEQEQKEIQKAMNALNDTLHALELDIYNQDLMQVTSDSDNLNISCNNSTLADIDDIESSSSSSLSAVTVLGKDARRKHDLKSPDNRSVEKNLSEEISTFSNSTFSLSEKLPGLFHEGNKSDSSSSESPPVISEVQGIASKKEKDFQLNENERKAVETSCSQFTKPHETSGRLWTPVDSLERDSLTIDRSDSEVGIDSLDRGQSVLPQNHFLHKSSSTESMTTISTEMTNDSLDSRPSSPKYPSPTPSLVDVWISKLVPNSVPYSKTKRKSKKKLILPESEIEKWEHVCQKQKVLNSTHDLNDSEPNLIDKLAHYSSKTMAGCDVAGYFHTLKQDVFKEHLKSFLNSGNQGQKTKKGISVKYKNSDSLHKKPLVSGQDFDSLNDGFVNCCTFSTFKPVEESNLTTGKDKDLEQKSIDSLNVIQTTQVDHNQNKISNGKNARQKFLEDALS